MTFIVQRSFFFLIVGTLFCTPSFVFAAGSLTISGLSPSSGTVSVNTPVTFSVVASGFTSPTFTISDDAGYNLAPQLNASGYFSWTPTSHHLGSHNLTITATDSGGNSASVTQTISVITPTASLSSLVSPTYPGAPVTFQVAPAGFTNPTYSIIDTFYGGTLTNGKLNASGAFFWVPTMSDIGTHKITVFVSDSYGHYVDIAQDFVVSTPPSPEVQSLTPGASVPAGATVTFSVTSPGYTTPIFSVFDSYSPSTVTSANLTSAGVFSWTPTASQAGTHNIRVLIVGSDGRSTDVIQPIVVESPTLSIEGYAGVDPVYVGDVVKFTVVAKGLSVPTFTTSNNRPGGSSITAESTSASGLFVWVPTLGDVGQHNIGVSAVDTYGNYAAVRKDIRVAVRPIVSTSTTPAAPPTIDTSIATSLPLIPPTPAASVPTTGGGYVFTRGLTIGSSGADVFALQKLLKQLGFFSVEPTGTFGPMTASAVKKFQTSNGLEAVGNVGPATRARLHAALGVTGSSGKYIFTKPLALGASGGEVLELQKKLIALGLLIGVPSGTFDIATLTAVKKFQAGKGFEQVGSVGPATRAALNAS